MQISDLVRRRANDVNRVYKPITNVEILGETDGGGLSVFMTCTSKKRSYAQVVFIPKVMLRALEQQRPNRGLDDKFRF